VGYDNVEYRWIYTSCRSSDCSPGSCRRSSEATSV